MDDPEFTDEADFAGYSVVRGPLGPGEGEDDELDPVVSTLDVFLSQTADLRLLQFPTRPPWRPYSYGGISSLRLSPDGQEISLDMPLDGPRILAEDEDDEEQLVSLPFRGTAVGARAGCAAGFVTTVAGKPAIVMRPLRDIYVFRPHMCHTDKGKDFRQFEKVADDPASLEPGGATRRAEEAEAPEQRWRTVELYSAVTGNARDVASALARPGDYPPSGAAPGSQDPFLGVQAPGAGSMLLSATRAAGAGLSGPFPGAFPAGAGHLGLQASQDLGMVVSPGSSQFQADPLSAGPGYAPGYAPGYTSGFAPGSTGGPAAGSCTPIVFGMTPKRYFTNLVNPTSAAQLLARVRLRPSARQQVEAIVADRRVVRFRAVRSIANRCRDDQECLNLLSDFTVCVRGFFVLKSHYIMSADRAVYRDYLLLLLALNQRGLSGDPARESRLLLDLAGDAKGAARGALVAQPAHPRTEDLRWRLLAAQREGSTSAPLSATEYSEFADEMVQGDKFYFLSRNRFTRETGLKAAQVVDHVFKDVMERQRIYSPAPGEGSPPRTLWRPSNACDGEVLIRYKDWCLGETNKWLAAAPAILQDLRAQKENAFLLRHQEGGRLKTLLSPAEITGSMRATVLETLGYAADGPGAQPVVQLGAQLGVQPGVQSGAQSGTRPEARPGEGR